MAIDQNELQFKLKQAGIINPRLVSRVLFETAQERAHDDDVIIEWAARVIAGEPYTKVVNEAEFYGFRFKVTNDTLDPRPDTETIIDRVLKRFPDKAQPLKILDLGTGTGCLAITLLKLYPNATAVAADISDAALEIARENANFHDVDNRIHIFKSSWGENIHDESFDLIVSNPPYITNQEMESLPESVKKYDPEVALAGGEDGLDSYRIIFEDTKRLLKRGGAALFECGFSQANQLMRLGKEYGFSETYSHPDLSGILRVVEISFGEK